MSQCPNEAVLQTCIYDHSSVNVNVALDFLPLSNLRTHLSRDMMNMVLE